MENNGVLDQNLFAKTYQANSQYIHRKIADMDVLISIGENIANFNGYVQMNSSAVCLWEALQQECTVLKLEEVLEQQFDVTHEQAEVDVEEFLQMMLERNMVVEK